MANGFRVNEKTRTVKVYRLSLNEKDYKIIERYKALDYDVIMLERKEPAKRAGIKAEDLKKYLNNGTIPEAIYKEMKERLDKKQNFLRVKSWLITALKDYADKNNTEYEALVSINVPLTNNTDSILSQGNILQIEDNLNINFIRTK